MANGSMTGDEPISEKKQDRLGRATLAEQIAKVISAYQEPTSLVFGIYGKWGSGKTSLLRMIEEALAPEIDCIWFNPWMFTDVTNLVRSFFKTIGEQFDKSVTGRKEKVGKWLEEYGDAIAPELGMLGIRIPLGKMAGGIGKAMSSSALEVIKEKIDSRFQDEKKRIVVFVDDVDRLDSSEIQLMLKMVKLTAHFDYLIYVLAFDDVFVGAAVKEVFPETADSDGGISFLEKIVQVPITLPPAEGTVLIEMCFEIVNMILEKNEIGIAKAQVGEYGTRFVEGFGSKITTPRAVKRYGNALTLALPALKDEVNPIDLMLIEGIRLFYPTAYSVIRDNKTVFTKGSKRIISTTEESKEYVDQVFEAALYGLSGLDKEAASALLKALFPRLTRGEYGQDWEDDWAAGKRVTSEDYFDKYFLYSVPSDQISDREMEILTSHVDEKETDQLVEEIVEAIGEKRADSFVNKLMTYARKLEPSVSVAFIRAVSRMGTHWPNPERWISYFTPYHRAGSLIRLLLINVEDQAEREALAIEVVSTGEPVSFALVCFYAMRDTDETDPAERLLTKEVWQELSPQSSVLSLLQDEGLSKTTPCDAVCHASSSGARRA